MNDIELDRKLRSVGKSAFVTHFDLFKSYSEGRLSKSQIVERLVELDVSK